jgi:hypothetical protein
MLRITHCLDDQLIDGGKVVSLTHRPRSTPQKYNFSVSGIHFSSRLSKLQGLVPLIGLGIVVVKVGSRKMFLGSKARPMRKANNLTAIFESTLTTLEASTTCYRDSFFF